MVRRGAAVVVVLAIAGVMLFSGRRGPDHSVHGEAGVPVVRVSASPSPVLIATGVGPAGSAAAATPPDADAGTRIPADPAIEAVQSRPDVEPRALYKRLRSERRDADWADRSERAIKAALRPIPYLDGSEPLRVNCGSSICEVAGSIAENASMENVNVAMQQLQGETLRQGLDRQGLTNASGMFGGAGKRTTFALYFTRGASPRP